MHVRSVRAPAGQAAAGGTWRPRRQRTRRRAALAVAVSLGASGVALLGYLGLATARGAGEATVVGVLTSVQQRDIGHAESFTLDTLDGRSLRFLVESDAPFNQTPGHLREHMLFAEPVSVRYRRRGGALVAVRVDDAGELAGSR